MGLLGFAHCPPGPCRPQTQKRKSTLRWLQRPSRNLRECVDQVGVLVPAWAMSTCFVRGSSNRVSVLPVKKIMRNLRILESLAQRKRFHVNFQFLHSLTSPQNPISGVSYTWSCVCSNDCAWEGESNRGKKQAHTPLSVHLVWL